MRGTDYIVAVCLFVCLFQTVQGDGHGGGLRFQCRQGWQLYEGVCYLMVQIPMTRDAASATCKRQGGDLFIPVNQQQFYDLNTLSQFPDTFWTGVNKDGQGNWRAGDDTISLQTISLWANYEPNESSGSCVLMNRREGASIEDCNVRDNFVCQYDACLRDFVPCALDSKCVSSSAICDGVYDCVDRSDERNCQSECTTYTLIGNDQVNSGFSTNTINDNTDCLWTLEAPIGKRIRIYIPGMTLESNVAFLHVLSGSPSIEESREVLWLTGAFNGTYVFSDNNFIHVRIYAGDLTAPISAKTLTWSTDIPNEMSEPTVLTSTDSYSTLVYPYPSSGPGPYKLSLYWRITAPEGHVISYHFTSNTQSGLVHDIYIKDGDMDMYHSRNTHSYYTTANNHLYVWMMYSDVVSEFTLYYKNGCNVSITGSHGMIFSPGDTLKLIPHELSCEWTMDAGMRMTPAKGMSIKFPVIDLANDPRLGTVTNDAKDTLMVFLDNSVSATSEPVQFDDDVANIIHASGGKIKLKFDTDVTLNSREFQATFGIDCDAPVLSSETIKSTEDTYYEEKVTLSCPLGYQFNLEKYKDEGQVTLECMMDGFMIGMDNVIPQCQLRRCGTPPKINNGFIFTTTNTSIGGIATYNCSTGFDLAASSSSNMITCTTSGQWTTTPECTSSSCPITNNELTVINGGYTVEAGNPITQGQTSAEFNMIIKFVCDPGYEIVGQLRSYCDNDGWDHTTPPTCKKLKCLIPEVDNAKPLSSMTMEYDDSLLIECESGYTGSDTVRCQANQTLDNTVTCTNVNECNGTNNCGANTLCVDNDGGYTCECAPGTSRVNDFTCTDILECNTNNGGCNGTCTELLGSYECSCPSGFELFTVNPLHGFTIPTSETGFLDGDIYRYNHTCIRVSCPDLTNPSDGKYLMRDLSSFNYEDRVTLQCSDGYYITGEAETVTSMEIECQASGMWTDSPTCSARSCAIPSAPTYGTFDKTSVTYQDTVTLTCRYTTSRNVTRTSTCIYDQGMMRLGGENMTLCPTIDCGVPVLPSGGVYLNNVAPSSTEHLNSGSTFRLTCNSGYDLKGGSGQTTNSDVVTCMENGRYDFGTLRCEGKRCSDPGTPVDATQIVSTYEIGEILRYECKRDGFKPLMGGVEMNYTCVYDSQSDVADWSNNLGPGNLPVCTDMEDPVLVTCPEDKSYFQMDTILPFNGPVFSDNFGINTETQTNYMTTDDVILSEQQFSYTVTDFENREASCSFTYSILDRDDKPPLDCPNEYTVSVMSADDGSQEVKEFLASYDDTHTLTINPVTVQRTLNNVGTAQIAVATLTDSDGRSSECTFMIYFTAGKCFQESLYPDSNADRSCAETTNGLSCNSTCKSGYIFDDGSTMKTFECTGTNSWTFPSDLDIFCLPIENPAFLAEAVVEYRSDNVAITCLADFNTSLPLTLTTFENNIQSGCDLQWDVTIKSYPEVSGIFDYRATLQINLLTLSSTTAQRTACVDLMKNVTEAVFAFPNNQFICDSTASSLNIKTLSISDPVESCITSTYNLRDVPNLGKLCLPCGPGRYFDATAGDCSSCPSNEYQDLINQVECKTCPTATAPDPQQIDCDRTCPQGFTSTSGFYPCQPCLTDEYWVDSKTCTSCPSTTSTAGEEGAENIDKCYAQCPIGTYSITGYNVTGCTNCPVGFYNSLLGQKVCSECGQAQTTDGDQKTSQADCTALTSCANFGCDTDGTQSCEYRFHRPVCICNSGFKGTKCEQKNEICDYNPCADPSRTTCVPVASVDNTDFRCTCRNDLDVCVMDVLNTGVEENGTTQYAFFTQTQGIANQRSCELLCINDTRCLRAFYVERGAVRVCALYDKTNIATRAIDADAAVYMEKNCTVAFDGNRCQNDLINNCPGDCANGSMCKDLVNATECLCPSIGGFSGPTCEQQLDLCASNPCGNNGNCTAFGTVRHQCTCEDGYTGDSCETLIDECVLNPGVCLYGGSCSPELLDYSCSCVDGFSGKYCANVPTFCTSNDCLGNVCYDSIDDRDGKCYCEAPLFGNDGMFACNRTASPCDYLQCENGGVCNVNGLTASCTCSVGYTGSLCQHNIDDCTTTSCQNGGTCNDLVQGFNCTCPPGFNGTLCENNIDECPGTCNMNNGGCTDGDFSFTCDCDAGYTGENCETDIDECLSYPCQHHGNCTQGINSYTCSCPEGWTGTNCESEIDDCEPNPCNGNGCFTIVDRSICRCEGGTRGQRCEDPANICDVLSNADLCQNDGTCQNSDGTAICLCKSEYSSTRCFFSDPLNDVSGGSTSFTEYIQGNSSDFCKDECLKLENCDGVTFSNNKCFFYTLENTVVTSDDGAVHFNRICPTDYAGDSCEFVKDWCKDNDTCQNGGSCTNLGPKGYRCDCLPGYSGIACENTADPCSTNPCGTVATCRSNVTHYICQCPEGKIYTGSSCRAPNPSYNLLVNTLNGEEPSCLTTPFYLNSTAFSVVMRLRIYDLKDDAVVFHLASGKGLMPLEGPTNFDLQMKKDGISADHEDHSMAGLTFGGLNGYGSNLFDGEWHHIGIAVDNVGDMSSTIDAVTSASIVNIGENITFDDNVQICLGSGVLAEYKDIRVWDYYLSKTDFVQDKVNSFVPQKTQIQGPWNYLLQPSTARLNGDLQKSPAPNMTVMVPPLDCSGLLSPVNYVLDDRFVTTDDIADLGNNLQTIQNNNPGLMFMNTLESELAWGYHEAIVVGMNEYDNYAQCRFPIYVKYNSQCPTPTTQSSDIQFGTCNSGDGVCSVNCIDQTNEGVAAALPRYIPCTTSGVYYTQAPYDDLVLPACNAKVSPKYVVTSSMQFEFIIDCSEVNLGNVVTVLRNTLVNLKSSPWIDICRQADCSDVQFTTTSCSSSNSNRFDLTFVLTLDNNYLTYSSSSGNSQINTEDALRMIIKLDEQISLSDFADGALLKDTVVITEAGVCTTTGSALIWEGTDKICVPCGPGRYYTGTAAENDCILCERGTYQNELGQMQCKSCGNDTNGNPRTTYQRGATSESACVAVCPPGQYYDEDMTMCMNCSRHYYQNEEGQNFCKPCPVGSKTVSVASTSLSDCRADCPAGQYRDANTDACLNCSRGTWRSLQYDDCQPCAAGRTTMLGELGVSNASCKMDNCTAGTYWNMTQCVDCDVGFYQPEYAMMMCEKCPKNYTTRNTKSNMSTDCFFYCAVGYEVDTTSNDTCKACERGKYKDNSGTTQFDPCQTCTDNTTDIIAATSSADCSVPKCDPGEVIVNGVCSACPKDTYSEVDTPYTSTQCKSCTDDCDICNNLYGTNKTGASNKSECILYCQPGYELMNGVCMECKRGFYKDNVDDASRFGMCKACSMDNTTTTDIRGAISVLNCTVPVCTAGQVVDGSSCTNCSVDTYQPFDVPLTTETCQACQPIGSVPTGTRMVQSSSATDCLPICEGGKEFDNSTSMCVACAMGTYKPADLRFDACLSCNESFTTNGTGAVSQAECNIRNCQPGTFINETLNDCQACPIGTYQDEPRKTSCKSCGDNLSTETEGASNVTQCQIFCNPGLQGEDVEGSDEKQCRPCPAHFFKNESGLTNCQECPANFTSNESRTACPDLYCYFGSQYNSTNGGFCQECAVGFFKDTKGNTDMCTQCTPGYTTNGTGQSACTLRFCVAGEYFEDSIDNCTKCPNGTYKMEAGNQECSPCPTNTTTSMEGATMVTQCDVDICPVGQYRNPPNKDCTVCEVNTYQDEVGQLACKPCPAGDITLTTASTLPTDCVPLCHPGEQYVSSNKSCVPCPDGTYKNASGNVNACTACPADLTTVGTGSNSSADCSQIVCPIGTRADSSTGSIQCVPCPVGTYNSETGQKSCTDCANTQTTLKEGADSIADCKPLCNPGSGYSVLDDNCQECAIGFFSRRQGLLPNFCQVCPEGFTTLQEGQDNCPIPAPPVPETTGFINFNLTVIYHVAIDNCPTGNFDLIETEICNKLRIHFRAVGDNLFSNSKNVICRGNGCDNINCTLDRVSCTPLNGRRKREVTHSVGVSTTFSNVSATLTDNQNNIYSFDTAVSSILTTDSADLTAQPDQIEFASFSNPVTTPICFPGEKLENNVCVKCPIGTFEESGICVSCPADTYQNSTGQTGCIECPENTFSNDLASPSESTCQSFCVSEVLYCFNRGTCFVTGRRTARCECFEDFSGDRCQSRDEPSSNTTVIVAAAIGGGGALLVLILVAVGVYRYMARNDLKKKKKRYTPDYEDIGSHMYERNAYDNYTMTLGSNQPRPYAPYPSIGYPALGYRPDPSFDDSGFHNVYKKAPSVNGDAGQDTFVWQA